MTSLNEKCKVNVGSDNNKGRKRNKRSEGMK